MDMTTIFLPVYDEKKLHKPILKRNENNPYGRLLAILILSASTTTMAGLVSRFFVRGWMIVALALLSVIAGLVLEALCWVSAAQSKPHASHKQ